MSELPTNEARDIDSWSEPLVFNAGEVGTEQKINELTAAFFTDTKQQFCLNALALEAAEEYGGWTEHETIEPRTDTMDSALRVVRELHYYEDTVVAAVITEHDAKGAIHVVFSRHHFTDEQRKAIFGEIEALDSDIARGAF